MTELLSRLQLTTDSQDTVTQLCSEANLLLVPETVLLSRLQLAGAVTAFAYLLLVTVLALLSRLQLITVSHSFPAAASLLLVTMMVLHQAGRS